MKIKGIFHNDLDGIGSYLVLSRYLGVNNIEPSFVDYGNVDSEVKSVIDNIDKYLMVFIADISIKDEEVIESICDLVKEQPNRVVLLDHHKTALHLNQYEWATVSVTLNDRPTCGTELVLNYCKEKNMKALCIKPSISGILAQNGKNIDDFVELVRRYDTWEWYNVYNDIEAKNLNDLLYILGKEVFIQKFLQKICFSNSFELFDKIDMILIEQRQKEIKDYIEKMNERIHDVNIGDYLGGLVFAERFTSELGNELSKMNPKYDFILIIKMSSGGMSFRTTKDNVDVSEIAKLFSGGGHPKASGALLDEICIKNFINQCISK